MIIPVSSTLVSRKGCLLQQPRKGQQHPSGGIEPRVCPHHDISPKPVLASPSKSHPLAERFAADADESERNCSSALEVQPHLRRAHPIPGAALNEDRPKFKPGEI